MTSADLTPWSAPDTPDANLTSSFNVDFNGAGEACPADAAVQPVVQRGHDGRQRDRRRCESVVLAHASPARTANRTSRGSRCTCRLGWSGRSPVSRSAVKRKCTRPNEHGGMPGRERDRHGGGRRGSRSGSLLRRRARLPDRSHDTQNGLHGPFGLAVVTPAVAGPFNLGNVVVRSAINIDPHTAAVTVTSDPLPQIIDGVPLRLRTVNVSVNRPGFMLNPTNCCGPAGRGDAQLAPRAQARRSPRPFGLAGCTSLPFTPDVHGVHAGAHEQNRRREPGRQGHLPAGGIREHRQNRDRTAHALPSRLTTIQKACPDTVFEANPATCPEGSVIGQATAHTPLLEQPAQRAGLSGLPRQPRPSPTSRSCFRAKA